MRMKSLGVASLGIVLFMQVLGCPKAPLPAMPLDETKAMRTELAIQHETTLGTLDTVLERISQFPTIPESINPTQFDMKLVTVTLTECFNYPIVEADDQANNSTPQTPPQNAESVLKRGMKEVKTCSPNSLNALNNYKKDVPKDVQDFITDKVDHVDQMRIMLKHVLPKQVEQLTNSTGAAKLKVEEYRKTIEANWQTAENNPALTDKERKEYKAQYDETKMELDAIDEMLENMEADVKGLPGDLQTANEQVMYELGQFGSTE